MSKTGDDSIFAHGIPWRETIKMKSCQSAKAWFPTEGHAPTINYRSKIGGGPGGRHGHLQPVANSATVPSRRPRAMHRHCLLGDIASLYRKITLSSDQS